MGWSGYNFEFKSYSRVGARAPLDADLLGDGFMREVRVVDELALHAGVELLVGRLVVASLDLVGGGEQARFSISLAEDVFALDAGHVASVSCRVRLLLLPGIFLRGSHSCTPWSISSTPRRWPV